MQNYELTYLISPELNEQELKDFFQKINSLISETGKVIKSEGLKRINLSYPIQKKRGAFLASFEFSAEPEKAENLKKELALIRPVLNGPSPSGYRSDGSGKKEKQILRFLLIKKRGLKEIKEKLKPVPAKKEKPEPVKKVELKEKEIEEALEEILDK